MANPPRSSRTASCCMLLLIVVDNNSSRCVSPLSEHRSGASSFISVLSPPLNPSDAPMCFWFLLVHLCNFTHRLPFLLRSSLAAGSVRCGDVLPRFGMCAKVKWNNLLNEHYMTKKKTRIHSIGFRQDAQPCGCFQSGLVAFCLVPFCHDGAEESRRIILG